MAASSADLAATPSPRRLLPRRPLTAGIGAIGVAFALLTGCAGGGTPGAAGAGPERAGMEGAGREGGEPAQATGIAQFRGGPGHTGVYAGADFGALGRVAWTACAGGAVRASAAVAGEAVYVGGGDGVLRALDAGTGELLWRYDAGAPIPSSPAVMDGVVVVVDRAGVVHALGAADGVARWTRATGPDLPMPWGPEGWDYFISSPLVVGDTVVVAGGDGVLRWLRARDGEALGRVALGTRLRSTPAYADGRVYVGGADGVVYAVDPDGWRILWRHATEGAGLRSAEFGYDRRTVQSSPVVVDGTVYIGARDGHLYALDAATGERRWRAAFTPSWVVSTPVVHDGVVYTGTSDAHVVQALDAATGEVRWTAELGTRVLGSPSLVGETLLVPGNDGALRALDAATGEEQWRYMAAAMIQSSPVVRGDLAFFGDDAGIVHALRAGSITPRLAVFHDSASAGLSTVPGGARLRDDLAAAGYGVLDAPALKRFLSERSRDRAPSVVVFAQDHLPPALTPDTGASPLRAYLESGGKAVWLGMPPAALVRDSTGRPIAFELERATALTGAPFAPPVGEHGALPTGEGRRWGLERVRLASFAADTVPGGAVLARDELGRAAAFARDLGGGPGTGFVFLWGRGYEAGMLPEIRRVAEAGVLRGLDVEGVPVLGCPAGTR